MLTKEFCLQTEPRSSLPVCKVIGGANPDSDDKTVEVLEDNQSKRMSKGTQRNVPIRGFFTKKFYSRS